MLFLKEIKKPVPFLGEKKHSKAVKTVLGTSQVLLLLSFGRDDLKPEKPIGNQTALKF
ncbi:hypothetical protein RKE98_003161 [Acinetobacter baumannii]